MFRSAESDFSEANPDLILTGQSRETLAATSSQ